MATGKNIKQTVTTQFEQVGAEGLQNALKEMLLKIQSIPSETKKVNPVVNQLAESLKKLSQSFAKNDLGTDQWITALKEVQNQLKTISTLSSGLKLFEKNDLDALRNALRVKSAPRLDPRELLGLPSRERMAATGREIAAQMREGVTQENLRAKSASAPSVEQLLGLRSRDDSKRLGAQIAAQMRDGVQQETLKAKSASGVDARRLLGLPSEEEMARLSAQTKAFYTELAKDADNAAKENARFSDLRAREQVSLAKEEAKKNAPSAGQRNLQARASLSTGEGAASLLLIQGALMANASVLNTAISSIKEAIRFSVELEASFRNVQAVTATTDVEMRGLESTIKQVSTTTKFGANEVAEAALTLGQAGLSAKQISESLMPVVTLANAAGSSIAQAVDLVTSVVGVFDKNSNDVADVANKITQAANGSKVSVDKLALGFQYAGNTAAQLGISFEEVTAAMAAMSNAGIKSGSTMGTGLRQFLTEVQKPSENFLAIMNRLGLSISDLDFKSKGFIGVIRTLKEAGFVASDAIQSFDVRGAAAFNALLARPDDLQNQYDSLNGSQAAMKANEIQMNSLSAQTSRLTNSLGVLASTGFEPVMNALTGLFRVVGDVTAKLGEFDIGLKIVGVALAGLAAAGIAAWIVPLVSGLGTLLAMLPSLTAGTAGLATAFGTLSIASGVGLAVGALVAGYTALQYIQGSTARSIDEATAALDKAKGAATEKTEVITSLSNRIETLSAREQDLTRDTSAFSSEIDQINSQISRWGYTTEGATASLGGLLIRLREVREEMRKMQLADMREAASKAGEVANAKIKDQNDKLFTLQDQARRGSFGKTFAGQDAFMASLTPQQRTFFEEGLKSVKSGDKQFLESGGASQMQTLMRQYRTQNPNIGGFGGGLVGSTANFDAFMTSLGSVGTASAEARNAQRAAQQAGKEVTNLEGMNGLRDRLKTQGVDLDSLQAGNIAARAKASLPAADQGNMVLINQTTRQLTEQTKLQLKAAEKTAMAAAQTDDQRQALATMFRAAEESMGESLRQSAPAAIAQVTREEKYSGDEAELGKLRKRISAKGGGSADDMARAKELVLGMNERAFIKASAGMSKEDYDATRAEFDRKAQEQIESLQETAGRAGSAAASSAMKSQESSWRALADAKMKEAKSTRSLVNANSTMEEISKTMDSGLAKIGEAKQMEIDSVIRQYGENSVEGKNLTQAAEEKYGAAAQTFIGGFASLIETVTTRTLGISKFVKETDAKIKKMFNDFEEQRYSEMGDIRANDTEASINKGPVSGRRRSEVDSAITTRARQALDLARAQADIVAKTAQMQALQTNKSILDAQNSAGNIQLGAARGRADSILRGRDTTQLSTEEFKQYELAAMQVNALEKELTKGTTSSEAMTDKLQALRDQIESLKNTAAGLTETMARPETWDELAVSMDKVWTEYNKIVQEQDVFATLENGMLGSLKGVQGGFATFFTDIATGTKSVSRSFKDMALSIIKSMMDVLAQALAMQAVKSILAAFTGASGASTGGGGGITGTVLSFGSVAMGGSGTAMAEGGPVTGGIPGKDSVPLMAMPGEFVLKKSAVDALGAGYLAKLNEASSSTIAGSTPSASPLATGNSNKAPTLTNIWLVTPDQMDGNVGPEDVVMMVSDNISRGGTLKKLIKTVAMGG